ncbi:MAG TPA: hypothetical protein VNZ62_14370 [Capillimicrobium sp.]|nr:hypothetical protein [Capillimicrobium sp.]
MKRIVLCGALAALLVPAAPAVAAKRKLKPCSNAGMANIVTKIKKRTISCNDARVLIRAVEAHAEQCRPYREQTIAPFRECVVTPVLSVGERNFFCRTDYVREGDDKRWWRAECRSFVGGRVTWRRDGNVL